MPEFDFRSPRLFVAAALAAGETVELERDQSNYLGNVLRLAAGAKDPPESGATPVAGNESAGGAAMVALGATPFTGGNAGSLAGGEA